MKLFFATISISFFWCFSTLAQSKKVVALEENVIKLNNNQQYEKSIVLLVNFISDDNTTSYEKSNAYILKANTYKSLFNYEETLHNLDLALKEGLKTNEKLRIINIVKAEKAFAYFDIQNYQKAALIMAELEKSNYSYLSPSEKAYIYMQEGYILMLNKNLSESDLKLDQAIVELKKEAPRNLPVIYGKKIELYNEMKLYNKRDETFRTAMRYAKTYKIMKYEMYLYEVLIKQYQKNNDYKNAFNFQKKFDSLSFIYNASDNVGKVELIEKKIEENQAQLADKYNRNRLYFLVGIIALLLILLFISIKLYRSNKEKRVFVENENRRIHNEIEWLTKAIDEKGNATFELSKYGLTERQSEIVTLIQQGKTNKEIANLLFISENTVKYHLKIIYTILDTEHRNTLMKR